MEDLSNLKFISEKNENLKRIIINSISEGGNEELVVSRINSEYQNIISEINENSNIRMIIKNKSDQEISDFLNELIQDHKDQSSLKKIESLEKELMNNLDENSYSELLRLKSQLNRD